MSTWSRAMAVTLATAVSASCHYDSQAPRAAAAHPNILLITIDTWRADRLRPDLTPNLSALAASGANFTTARSAVPLTLPSHTTILTGLWPPAHGVRENGVPLAETYPTLATILKSNGYQTAAFIGAFVLDRRFGLARGFDVYDDRIPRDPNATEKLEAERPASAVIDAALAWLEARGTQARGTQAPGTLAPGTPAPGTPAPGTLAPGTLAPGTRHQAPFFVWIHLYDPHAPYMGSYDAEVSSVDTQVARLISRMARDKTVILLAGDHGEGLGDHGERTHGMLLYDSTLRVPLFITGPAIKAEQRAEPVSLVDIAPTLLARAGAAPLPAMNGRDLLGGTSKSDADIYAETEYPHVAGWTALQALTDGRWKAIRAGRDAELYDVASDPAESKNVATAQASTATAMSGRIETIRARGASAAPSVSAEAAERLRALGYVASSAQLTAGANAPNPSANIADWNAFEDALTALNRDAKSALPGLKRLADAHPDAPVFLTTYARAVKDSGKPADALVLYRAAAKRWPTDATLLHDLAVAARDAGKLDEAVKADQAALALQPGSPIARNGLGLLAIDQGRPQDAVRAFTEATAIDPNNASYWSNLGNAKHAAGDAAGAEQAYRKALDVDARFADAANGLGVLLVEAKRPVEAVTWFNRALDAAPQLVEARLNLGIALQQSGEPDRAATVYRVVLAAPGSHPREKDAARHLLASLGAGR